MSGSFAYPLFHPGPILEKDEIPAPRLSTGRIAVKSSPREKEITSFESNQHAIDLSTFDLQVGSCFQEVESGQRVARRG
jgi:hypothetical protein